MKYDVGQCALVLSFPIQRIRFISLKISFQQSELTFYLVQFRLVRLRCFECFLHMRKFGSWLQMMYQVREGT